MKNDFDILTWLNDRINHFIGERNISSSLYYKAFCAGQIDAYRRVKELLEEKGEEK